MLYFLNDPSKGKLFSKEFPKSRNLIRLTAAPIFLEQVLQFSSNKYAKMISCMG